MPRLTGGGTNSCGPGGAFFFTGAGTNSSASRDLPAGGFPREPEDCEAGEAGDGDVDLGTFVGGFCSGAGLKSGGSIFFCATSGGGINKGGIIFLVPVNLGGMNVGGGKYVIAPVVDGVAFATNSTVG